MWTKKENTYESTDVNYHGGLKYGSDIHQVAVRTNQIVWDMIKELDHKDLYGFHFSAKLGTKKTIVNITHNDEAMLSQAKKELHEFNSIDGMMMLYKTKKKREKNYVKIALILLFLLGGIGAIGTGVGYYLYTQTNIFNVEEEDKSSLYSSVIQDETETIEIDIQTLTALKESFEKQEKSETEKATIQAMVVTTDIISQIVPDSLKDQYSSEEVVRKFKGNGETNIILKGTEGGSADLNSSIAELNAYALDYMKNNEYDKALGYYQQVIESQDSNASARMESYAGQGDIYVKSDALKEAKIAYENTLNISKRLTDEDKVKYQNSQAWVQSKLAKVHHDLNQTEEAESIWKQSEKIYLKTVDLFKGLAQKNPKEHRQNLAWAYNMLANFYHNERQAYEESIQVRQKALNLYSALAQKQSKLFFERLFRTYNSLGLSYQELQKYRLAQQSYQKAFDLTQSMRIEESEIYRKYLAHSLNLLGVVYTKSEAYNKANKHLKQAESMYKELLFVDSHRFEPYLLAVQQDIATLYAHQEAYAKAWQLYQKVIVKYQTLSEKKPLHFNALMAKVLNSMAWISLMDEKSQKKKQVRRLLRESLMYAHALAKIDHAKYTSLSSTSYVYWAYLSLQEGSMLEAFKYYEKALTLVRDYYVAKSYLLLLISKKSLVKADNMFKSMLEEYRTPQQQAELWMLYGKFYMQIDSAHAQLKLERSLSLYQDLNDTLKITAITILLEQNSSNEDANRTGL